jgi:hypothetical protein
MSILKFIRPGAFVVGCKSGGSDSNSYPASPPLAKTAATEPSTPPAASAMDKASPIKVPADAEDLSNGDYPPPAFPAPSKPGLIMVVDLDGDPTTAVASTAVTGKDGGKMMSITDIPNMSVTMNKLHKYRIVFVPSGGTTTP